ncbi:ATP-binding protein [Oscillibacter sp. GMB15532]|uniref:ATP-binding protein n=1 Tax=Oscillibacter sp. GMB15532 TaxID=3230022 RepID=UPI0034DFB98A
MALTAEEKKRLLSLFEVPEDLSAEAVKMLSQQEMSLILLMEKHIIPSEDLKKEIAHAGIAENPERLIQSAYSRSVLDKVRDEDGGLCYRISNFYGRYPYFAQFEYEEYARFSREKKDRLNEWDFELYYNVFGKDVQAKIRGEETYVHNSTFLTLPEAFELMEKHRGNIYRVPCNCKCMMDVTEKPRNVCINFDSGDNTPADRGHGEKLTLEFAKELTRDWNRQGLMQNGEDFAICNCDGQSCYPLQMARKAGAQGIYPRSNYEMLWNEETCVNCGACARICNFGAFVVGENKKVSFHQDLCWGCTICSANCPKGAITLAPRGSANCEGQAKPIHH